MQRNPSFKQTFECKNNAFLFLKWINKMSSKVNKASLALPFYAFIQTHSSFTWEYICHSGAPQFLSLEDISPDHPLLTSFSSTHPHRNETFSVGRFTEFQVLAKRRLANEPRKSLSHLTMSLMDFQWEIRGRKMALTIWDVHAQLYGSMQIC